MSDSFQAIVASEDQGRPTAALRQLREADLADEDVLVDVSFSTLNYKDGLALTRPERICRKLPLILGIDLAGTVRESRSPDWQAGDRVLVNGYGLSETRDGGYTQRQRLNPLHLLKVPDGLSLEQAMAVGTAGYTAMLCVHALEDHGVDPGDGPVLVTGAAGGVGSTAVMLLSALGYTVCASSGRLDRCADYLHSLGAGELLAREELSRESKPLEKERWPAVVDCVGGAVLATALSQTRYNGIVAACGLAGGAGLPGTVMPFILRGVTLRGIDSVMADHRRRQRAWAALDRLLDRERLADLYRVEPMSRALELAPQILAGEIRGRVVIDVNA